MMTVKGKPGKWFSLKFGSNEETSHSNGDMENQPWEAVIPREADQLGTSQAVT